GRLGNSLVLAAAALVVIVPLSIALGTVAALRQDRLSDRAISIAGLSLMAVPEFVSGIILLTVFGIWLHVLPTGSISSGGSPLTLPQYLALPGLAPGLVRLGYIARLVRARLISVLCSACVRTGGP